MMTRYHTIQYVFAFNLLVFFSLSCGKNNADDAADSNASALFKLLPPEQTKVSFQNTLVEGLNTNILMYEYFYNGGGVATGDFNGDGFADLYFTSNMGDNKLYIHKGQNGIEYLDVTQASGAGGRPGPWKTGVCAVDINGDNKLDIYVSYSGALPDEKRKNQLFINKGNDKNNTPLFEDQAAQYGLASAAFSNQAYFLDYDRDGDLDMLLLNHNPKNLPILNEVRTAELLKIDDPMKGLRLFKQEDGKFTDVTAQAGISGSELSYGLGLGIADFNGDDWPDFYVSNDYAVPDYYYINNQKGGFTNQLSRAMGHTSQFSMGNDVADLNNDGWQDVITLDMLPEDNARQKLLLAPDNYGKFDQNVRSGFYYQYMRNMLQLNNGDGTFSEIGQYAGISNTDWSWSALAADYDNDGWRDLYVTNGYKRDYTNLDFINYMDEFVRKKGRLVREDVLEIIDNMPASDVVNYMFQGSSQLQFANRTKAWGLARASNSNGAVYADLDNDGDLDLVVNNINQPAFIYENLSDKNDQHYLQVALKGNDLNTQGIGAKVRIYADGKLYYAEQYPSRGYLSSVSPILHFGLGKATQVDSLFIMWPGGKQQLLSNVAINTQITLKETDASSTDYRRKPAVKPVFKALASPVAYENPKVGARDFDRQKLLLSQYSTHGPCMASGDLNGDGLQDLVIGGASGQNTGVYLQTKTGGFTPVQSPDFDIDKLSEDTDIVLLDANGDGAPDLYVASGGYHYFQPDDPMLQDRLYLNDGKARFTKKLDALPPMTSSKGCVTAADINADGFTDLFVGGRVVPGRYPETPASYILINDGKGRFSDQTKAIAPELAKVGLVCDAIWTDINGDKQPDLMIAGEWMPISIFVNNNGKLSNQTEKYLDNSYSGFWNRIESGDLNNDQKPDFVIGNFGLNTQFEISEKEPAEMYFSDFDNNGSVDPVFCYFIQGQSYPYLTRDELFAQLASFRKIYTSYKSYSTAVLGDLFPQKTISKAGHLTANYMASSILLSSPDGKYKLQALPAQAQYAPIYAIRIFDYDQDGKQDLLLCGNNNQLKLRLGRADANYGLLMKGDGQGNFVYQAQPESGLSLRGDVRSIVQIDDLFLFGVNQQPITAYRLNKGKK